MLHPPLSAPFLSAFWVLALRVGGAVVEKALTCPPCFDSFEWDCGVGGFFPPSSFYSAAPTSLELFVNTNRDV